MGGYGISQPQPTAPKLFLVKANHVIGILSQQKERLGSQISGCLLLRIATSTTASTSPRYSGSEGSEVFADDGG
jgi:hypothetical protein